MSEAQTNDYVSFLSSRFQHGLTNLLAALMMIVIIVSSILLWPIPFLGYTTNPASGIIIDLQPESVAAKAGLQVGDRIVELYNLPWVEVTSGFNRFSHSPPRGQLIPIRIDRQGTIHTFNLEHRAPDLPFQLKKITDILLVFLCWLTGYILGHIRRHEAFGSPFVAWFWLAFGGTLGIYFLSRYFSYPLKTFSQWMLITTLIPLFVYIHLWFPARPIARQQAQAARRRLIVAWVLLNTILAALLLLGKPSLLEFTLVLGKMLSVIALGGLISTWVILRRAYRRTNIAHVRRQIRLIAIACLLVGTSFIFILTIPTLLAEYTLIDFYWVDLLLTAIPLAYLFGGVLPDLDRLDRLMLRFGVKMMSVAVLVVLLSITVKLLSLERTPAILWSSLCFVALYRPTEQLGLRLLPAHMISTASYRPLHAAMTKLTATLEAPNLVTALCEGIATTFQQPAMAFYLGDLRGSNELTLQSQQRMAALPHTIAPGTLTNFLCSQATIIESRDCYTALAASTLTTEEEDVLRHQSIVLWCPIHHTDGYLLGLLLLGMRSDLDPYREQDLQEIQRLIEAAALALANSAAYALRQEAETVIRQLYQSLQQAQEATAARIARELHDEVININVRLNIESLQQVIDQIEKPAVRNELALVLQSERDIGQTLRIICEELAPTGSDDPLGLPTMLRRQVEKLRTHWSGSCELVIEHDPCPIAARTQQEAIGIVKEALNNVIKHAEATHVVVSLCYPTTSEDEVKLIIRDNGRSGQVVKPSPGHLGIRGMLERARLVNGAIEFQNGRDGGTTVVFTFPPGVFELAV